MKSIASFSIAAGLLFAAAGAASADTITIQYDSPNIFNPLSGNSMTVYHNGSGPLNVSAGRFQATATAMSGITSADLVDSASDLFTYCYDLDQYIWSGGIFTYTINYSGPTQRTLDFLGAVDYVLNGNSNLGDFNAWLHPTSSVISGAIQLGIWESLYDSSGWDIAAGNFHATNLSSGVSNEWALFQTAVQNAGVNDLPGNRAMTIVSASYQDQIIGRGPPISQQSVPEPGSLALVAIGMLVTSVARRRRGKHALAA